MPMNVEGAPPRTGRELFEERTAPAGCQSCHKSLNGFGFGLEGFSATGAFRTTENGQSIDARGHIYGTDVDRAFVGGVDLSQALAGSKVVYDCATERWLTYALGRAPTKAERPLVLSLSSSYLASKGDVRALLTSIVLSPTFRMRKGGAS